MDLLTRLVNQCHLMILQALPKPHRTDVDITSCSWLIIPSPVHTKHPRSTKPWFFVGNFHIPFFYHASVVFFFIGGLGLCYRWPQNHPAARHRAVHGAPLQRRVSVCPRKMLAADIKDSPWPSEPLRRWFEKRLRLGGLLHDDWDWRVYMILCIYIYMKYDDWRVYVCIYQICKFTNMNICIYTNLMIIHVCRKAPAQS